MNCYVARQAIFDRDLRVFGCELFFRDGVEKVLEIDQEKEGDRATAGVINSFFLLGMLEITGGKRAFINFTERMLQEEIATILPKASVVVEILENVAPSDEIITSCRKLKDNGYMIAVDDYCFQPGLEPLLHLADIIKVDFLHTGRKERLMAVERFRGKGAALLAEKVETYEEFNEAVDMGYSYFQGYFFEKPVIVETRDISGSKVQYMRLLQVLGRTGVEFAEIEELIKKDVSLTFKLLKYINSAAFGLGSRVRSIRQALVLLGMVEIKKWLSIVALGFIGDDKAHELHLLSLFRGRFCELVGNHLWGEEKAYELFLVGLFSVIDVFLGRPLAEILAEGFFSEPVRDTLAGEDNDLRRVYELIVAYEKGRWQEVARLQEETGIDGPVLSRFYIQALTWAHSLE